MTVEFTLPGRLTSANGVTRNVAMIVNGKARSRSLKSKEAREDTARIQSIALAAKLVSGWRVPDRARITILAYNSRIDADNISKVLTDAIKGGLLIVDDRPRHLKSLYVEHQEPDHLSERYVVRVRDVEAMLPL